MAEKERDQLIDYLNKNSIAFSTLEHEPVFTSEEAAKIRKSELNSGVKAILFKEIEGESFLVLIRADKKIDVEKLKGHLNKSKIRMARTKELRKITECEPGSVHPFGNLWGLKVLMDKNFNVNQVNFNAGTHTFSISMQLNDLVSLIKPEIVDVAT